MATSNVSLLLEQTQQFPTKENVNNLLHTVQSSYSSNTEGLTRGQAEAMLKLITKNIGQRDEHNRRRLDFKSFQVLELFHFLLFSDTQFRQLVGEQTIESLRLSYMHRYLEEEVLEKYKQFAAEIVHFLMTNFTQFENYKLYINVRYLEELETRLSAIESSSGAHPQMPSVEQKFTESMLSIPFYNLPAKAVVELLKVNPETGLSEAEVQNRRQKYGPNEISKPVHTSALVILLHQLTDFIAAILIITAIVAALMGDVKASVVLMLVIFFNITVGFVQEYKAERALESLEQLDVQHASVQRESSIEVINASELVPGDIVVLEEGMQVPADLRLIECSSLSVLESILTGESIPVDKQVDEIESRDVAVGDRTNMAYMSTTVTRGRAKGVVVATGKATEVGKISRNLAETTKRKTPLEEKLQKLGYIFVALSFGLCAVVVIVGILRGNEWQEMIKTGVSLAVSVIPDGLVAATTVTMSLGVQRMAKKNAIVRQLSAVETLGSITVICSDKTGTLTEGKMNLAGIWVPGNNIYHLSTTEEQPAVYLNKQQINSGNIPEELSKIFWVLALCNNATVKTESEGSPSSPGEPVEVIGDPTEVAFEVAARKIGLHKEEWINKHGFKYIQEFPFDSERKRMSVIYEYTVEDARSQLVLSKGAPETILSKGICNRIQIKDEIFPLKENIIKYLEQKHTKLSSRGLRVLALAYKELSAEESKSKLHSEDVEKDLIFLGFAGLVDSPRAGVQKSIQVCKEAGIKVVMITGDHPLTARSIASSLGIISDDPNERVLRGKDIDELVADRRLQTLQPFPQVFARVSPDNKLQIVETLQHQGEVVSMIGDGVNDATSIRRSDVGVCMGKSGTDVAKQAASIILTDDNFSTIVNAIREGRRIFDNIEKFVMYLLSCNLAEVLLMLAAVMLGTPVPFTPIQILYANLVADTPPAFCLGIEKEDPDIMNRKPRNPKSNIFSIYGWIVTAYYGVVMSGLTYAGMLLSLYYDKEPLEKTRSFTFALLIVIQLAHAFHCKSTTFSVFHKSLMSNVWLVLAVAGAFFLLVIGHYVPFLSHTLQLLPLTTYDWIKIAIGVALHTALVEVVKLFLRYRKRVQSERKDERFFSEL